VPFKDPAQRRGYQRAYGIANRDRAQERQVVRRKEKSAYVRTRRSWAAMRERCADKTGSNFLYYGARGIQVCERWADFGNFLADMGFRPAGTSLDRIDSDGHYEPSNCRWADAITQARNRRGVLSIHGLTQLEYARAMGVSDSTVQRWRAAGKPLPALPHTR
jgi:hypothetical protein